MKNIIIAVILLVLFLLPVFFILYQALYPFNPAAFPELPLPVLATLARNTFAVVLISSLLAFLTGLVCAVVVSYFEFPGRKFLESALCLPLALPPYLLAGVYRDVSHQYYKLGISVENLQGAGLVFAFALYPYFYILLKNAFQNQAAAYREAGKCLGLNYRQSLTKIMLPLARPAVFTGLLLIIMEVAGDYGAANLLGIRTLTVGIYDTWFSMHNPRLAAMLSLLLFAAPLLVIFLFTRFARKAAFHNPPNHRAGVIRQTLSAPGAIGAIFVALVPLAAGFIFPTGVLISWAAAKLRSTDTTMLYTDMFNTVILGASAALISLAISLLLSYLQRNTRFNPFIKAVSWVINAQYAVPGIVTGIALLFLTSAFYNLPALRWFFDSAGLVVYACVIRYICFAFFSTESGMQHIPVRLDEASAALHKGKLYTLFHLHFPLLKSALITGFILVFINITKELTMSLVLQPFHYSSLALRIYSFARMDMLKKSALYALFLVLLSLYPVFIMNKWFSAREHNK